MVNVLIIVYVFDVGVSVFWVTNFDVELVVTMIVVVIFVVGVAIFSFKVVVEAV